MYTLVIEAKNGDTRLETFATQERMSSAHAAYGASGIAVTPIIDGFLAYAIMDNAGNRKYYTLHSPL